MSFKVRHIKYLESSVAKLTELHRIISFVKFKLLNDSTGEFYTWKIEESVKNIETVGVISLNELVGVVVVNVFPAEHKHNTGQYCKWHKAVKQNEIYKKQKTN